MITPRKRQRAVPPSKAIPQTSKKTVLELDLYSYNDIATFIEENLDVAAVRAFEDQIQQFVDYGLQALDLRRDDVVLGTAGDNAVLIFDDASTMHRFAEAVHQATLIHNRSKTVELAKRWFRMGAATGIVEFDLSKRRIVGITTARAVRLEAASEKGQLVIDLATFDALQEDLKGVYGAEELIEGKREERYKARRCTLINVPDTLAAETALEGAASREDGRKQDRAKEERQTAEAAHQLQPATDFDDNRSFAAFYGQWVGIWDNNPIATTSLIIESISPTGDVTGSYVFMGKPSKLVAKITDNTLSFGSLCKFTFRLRPDGKMEGTRNDSGMLNTTVLNLQSTTDFDEKFAALSGRWVGIWDNEPTATTSLIIESVTPPRDVTGSYVFMSSTPIKFVATIIENTITFGGLHRFTFKLRPDGKIEGTRNANGAFNTTVLTRVRSQANNNFAAFPGLWVGIWDNDPQYTTSLNIDSVSPTGDVTGSYVFMSATPVKFATKITDNAIYFGSINKFMFRLRPDGKMDGTRNTSGVLNTTVLIRDQSSIAQ
jgi:class 3 adenylate cyclase